MRRSGFSVLSVTVLTALLATGCGARGGSVEPGGQPGEVSTEPTESAEPDGRLALLGEYVATAVSTEGKPKALVDGTAVSLRFTDDSRLVANAGCNTLSGPVDLLGGRVEVRDLSMTDMGCDQPRHAQDEWLSAFLSAKPAWRADGETVVLTGADSELTLARKAARQLVGTRWVVDTVIDGQVAGSAPQGSKAFLIFDANGTLQVGAGCNTGSTTYNSTADTITVDPPILTLMACTPEVMALEQAVVAVLDGTVKYRLDSETLTLTAVNGKGIAMRAQPQ